MDGQGLDAAVLQLFGQGGNDKMLLVPAQAGLDGDGNVRHGIHDGTRYLQHEGDVLEHTGSGTLASHTLNGAAEVDVENIGMGLFDDNLCGVAHRFDEPSVNLDSNGALLIADGQFLDTAVHASNQGVARYKL